MNAVGKNLVLKAVHASTGPSSISNPPDTFEYIIYLSNPQFPHILNASSEPDNH